jgi:hypothetical protein
MKLAPKITPIIPIHRDEIPTDPAWAAELKLDGFRGIADTIRGKLLSKNLNPLKRLRHIPDSLPLDCVFDGEICVPDQDGKPQFNDLLFGRADPVYVFDLLFYGGEDIPSMPLKERRAVTGSSCRALRIAAVGIVHWLRQVTIRDGVRDGFGGRHLQAARRPILAADAMVQGAQQGIFTKREPTRVFSSGGQCEWLIRKPNRSECSTIVT